MQGMTTQQIGCQRIIFVPEGQAARDSPSNGSETDFIGIGSENGYGSAIGRTSPATMAMAEVRRKKRQRANGREEECSGAPGCSGLIRGRFRTTRSPEKKARVAHLRDAICGTIERHGTWVRAEMPSDDGEKRPWMMHVQSLWKRRETHPGLYMSPAPVKDVIDGDVSSYYPEELKGDVLVKHDGFLQSEGRVPSNLEFLVGARSSYSSFHRDGGLICWVTIEVLQGKKRVVVMPREWDWADGDGDLDWVGVEEVCKREGGYSTVLGQGEAVTFWSNAPHAAFNDEPTISLSFAWLAEEPLLDSLTRTFRRELGLKTASWEEDKLVQLVRTATIGAFARFQNSDRQDREGILLEVYRLFVSVKDCHDRRALLPKRAWKMVMTAIRTEFFRKM